jgi:hypothetical protein
LSKLKTCSAKSKAPLDSSQKRSDSPAEAKTWIALECNSLSAWSLKATQGLPSFTEVPSSAALPVIVYKEVTLITAGEPVIPAGDKAIETKSK